MPIKSFIVGTILPTILLGVGSVLMKQSLREGSSIANYLTVVGLTMLIVGIAEPYLPQDGSAL